MRWTRGDLWLVAGWVAGTVALVGGILLWGPQ